MIKVLKNRNFLLISTGKLVSLMGNSIFEIAVMWYVLTKYGKSSGTMLALIMFMAILPTVVLGSIAGSIIDRYNKKVIMILSDAIAGVVVFGILFLMRKGTLNSFELLVATGILSVTSSTVRIAVNSIIPIMFLDRELYDANGVNQFIERGTSLLGFALGGTLISLLGIEKAIFLNGISFVICAFLEMFLLLPKEKKADETKGKQSIIKDFGEVKIFLRENSTMLRVVLVFTAVNFFLDPIFNIAMPYILKNVFNISSANLGLIIASLPLGFCIGALFFSKRPNFLLNRFVLFNSILALNSVMLLFSIPIILWAQFSKFTWVPYYLMLCLVIGGIFSAAINISASVAMQRNIPESIRGKFMGISSSLSAGLLPLGSIIVGALLGRVSPSAIYAFSIIAIFGIIIIIPKRTYSFENDAETGVNGEAEVGI